MQKDKKLHLMAGFLISIFFSMFLYFVFRNVFSSWKFFENGIGSGFAGAVVATIAGIVKEVRDSQGYGTPEVADFMFTVLGGCIGAIPVMFF